jgi:hypothetical protein
MDIDIIDRAPETKAGIAEESYATHDDLMRVFEQFKAAQDERIAQLERRGATDVLTQEKAARRLGRD